MRQLLGASAARPPARLRPLTDPRQLIALSDMGISVITLADGRVQLLYTTSTVSISFLGFRIRIIKRNLYRSKDFEITRASFEGCQIVGRMTTLPTLNLFAVR